MSAGLSAVTLFAVGAAMTILTGRRVLFSGARMLAIGAVAAAITYEVGLARRRGRQLIDDAISRSGCV